MYDSKSSRGLCVSLFLPAPGTGRQEEGNLFACLLGDPGTGIISYLALMQGFPLRVVAEGGGGGGGGGVSI